MIAAALGDPLRIRILDLLAAGRRKACCSPEHPEAPVAVCACDITKELGDLSPSKLAYHLAQLRAANLVSEQRRGKWVYYSINEDALSAFTAALASRWHREADPPPPGKPAKAAGSCASACLTKLLPRSRAK